jgi:hypothetical protein
MSAEEFLNRPHEIVPRLFGRHGQLRRLRIREVSANRLELLVKSEIKTGETKGIDAGATANLTAATIER